MLWHNIDRKHWTEHSVNCGPVTLWICEDDSTYDTVIHYGGKTEIMAFNDIETAKEYCKRRAIELLQETLLSIQTIDNR